MSDSGGKVNSRRELDCTSRSAVETQQTLRSAFNKATAYNLRGEWICTECRNICLVVREECRCLCGHRLKEHINIRKKAFCGERDADDSKQNSWCYKCIHPKCKCNHFFYIVGEGAWILRCRCKHKHTEHDPVSFKCTKAQCKCNKFDSPWVCNCNHPWSAHVQRMRLQRRPQDVESQLGDFVQVAREVNNLDDLRRDSFQTVDSRRKLPPSYPSKEDTDDTTARSPSGTSTKELTVSAR